MFESKSGVILIAGLAFFGLAFLGNAIVPMLMVRQLPELSVRELIIDDQSGKLRNPHVVENFRDLYLRYPESFIKHVGEPPMNAKAADAWWVDRCSESLRLGRDVYVAEACWHCHSQFVRPVSNESSRWGPVSKTWEYQNELQRPVLFGTRRVGPDLSREAARRTNDWHVAHFHSPKSTSPYSVMPRYTWFFDGDPEKPNKRGIAIITYMQWLGSWLPTYPYYETFDPEIDQLHEASYPTVQEPSAR